MSEESENILNYASTQFGTQTEEPPANTEMVDATTPVTENTEPSEMEAAKQTEEANIQTPPLVDYGKTLEEISGGMFKDVESFKSALPKFTEYDTLASQKAELEEKIKINPFANDYVKTLNDLVKSGAGADQIKNFQKVNEVDLDKLSHIDAKVAKMVLIEGYSENIARKIVDQEYPINEFEEGTDEREILEEKLRINSKGDLEALSKYKADLSKIDTTEAEQKETQRLQAIAQTEQHKSYISQVVPKLAEAMSTIGELTIKPAKEGEGGYDAMKLNFDFTPEFKSQIPDMLSNYFLDGNEPVTDQSVADAYKYVKASYLEQNIEKILQANTAHVESITWEKAVNKYENRSGLPKQEENVTVDTTQADVSNFLNRVANGR